MAKQKDVDFLEFIIKALVDHPDEVKVDRNVDEMGVLLTLNINPEDMGYVIGRKGQNAHAVRTLLRIVGAKNNARVNMRINEPEGSKRPQRPERGRNTASADVNVDDLNI
ncbi:KH domain-containing protein [Patescibacteria group bacterium]